LTITKTAIVSVCLFCGVFVFAQNYLLSTDIAKMDLKLRQCEFLGYSQGY